MPEPLRRYILGSPEFISYTKELPKDSTSTKLKSKADKEGKPKPQAPAATPPAKGGSGETSEKMASLKM